MITTTDEEKAYVETMAVVIGAQRVLEIGAFKGETTVRLSRAVRRTGGYVVAIDPLRWVSPAASLGERFDAWRYRNGYAAALFANLERAGASNVIVKPTVSTDPALLRDGDPHLWNFDLVFIDGEHSYSAARADLMNWGTRVRPGGLILLHDVRSRFSGVERSFHEAAGWLGAVTVEPLIGSVGVLRVAGGLERGRSPVNGKAPRELLPGIHAAQGT